MKLRRLFTAGLMAGTLAAFTQSACTAELESECVGGDGTCDGFTTSSSTGTGGNNTGGGTEGGGGSAPECYAGCDTESVSGNTGEFPCEVEVIMDNCRRCHSMANMAGSGAPFPLDTYEDSQELYVNVAIWARLRGVIIDNPDFMPLSPPKLTPIEKIQLLDDWACQCAPPRPAGETCD